MLRAAVVEVVWLLAAAVTSCIFASLLFGFGWLQLQPMVLYTPETVWTIDPGQSAMMFFSMIVATRYAVLITAHACRAGGATAVRVLIAALLVCGGLIPTMLEGVRHVEYWKGMRDITPHDGWAEGHFAAAACLWVALGLVPLGMAVATAAALLRTRSGT